MSTATGAGLAAAGLLAATAVYQAALALGAPWAAAAYGGRAARLGRSLPARLRLASAGAAIVLLGAGWVVLAACSVLGHQPLPAGLLHALTWGLVVVFAVNTLGNLAARHWFERRVLSGVTSALTVLVAVVALA